MSPSSWSDSCWSCARCSGVIELSIACIAAMRRAIASSSSSRSRGFSGKKSPKRSMNVVELRVLAALVALEHLVEGGQHVLHPGDVSGVIYCIEPAHLLEHLVGELAAQALEQRLEPALGLRRREVVGAAGRPPCRRGPRAAGRGAAAARSPRRRRCRPRRSSPVRSAAALASRERLVDRVALLVDDVVELAGDLVVHAAEVEAVEPLRRAWRSRSSSSRSPASGSPLRSRSPSFISRRSAAVTSPCSIRSSVIDAEQVVGVELEPAAASRPSGSNGSDPGMCPSLRRERRHRGAGREASGHP